MEALGEEFEIGGVTAKASFQHNKFWPRWTRSIFVRNLPYTVGEGHVEEYFSQFGEVLGVRMPRDDNGNGKGFAWVEYLERSAFFAALEANGEDFLGRELAVAKSRKPQPRDQQQQSE